MSDSIRKYNEAAYFLTQMGNSLEDPEIFGYNLNAFVGAARSTTLVMQTEFDSNPDFKPWYKNQQREMAKDPDFAFFNNQRVKTVHNKPILPQVRISTGPMTITASSVVTIPLGTVNEKGMLDRSDEWINIDDVPHPEIEKPPIVTAFVFDEKPDEDAMALCERYLLKIKSIIQSWQVFISGRQSSQVPEETTS